MSDNLVLRMQAKELCQEIRTAVESFWIFDANGTYSCRPLGPDEKREFSYFSSALASMAFDSQVVKIFNLLDDSNSKDHLSLKSFANALDEAGGHAELVDDLRNVCAKHLVLKKSIKRVRNNGVGHLNSRMSSSDHLDEASWGTRETRCFLQDCIYLFDRIGAICDHVIGPPDRRVQYELEQMFHLATLHRKQLHKEVSSIGG